METVLGCKRILEADSSVEQLKAALEEPDLRPGGSTGVDGFKLQKMRCYHVLPSKMEINHQQQLGWPYYDRHFMVARC